MPEENARGLETLTTPSDFAVRDLGQSKPPPTPAALEDVDEEHPPKGCVGAGDGGDAKRG